MKKRLILCFAHAQFQFLSEIHTLEKAYDLPQNYILFPTYLIFIVEI